MMKLSTEFVYLAPNDERYICIDENEYDGAPDAGPQVVGRGSTAEASRADFWEQWLEREAERGCKNAVKNLEYWDAFFHKLMGIKHELP